MTIDTSAVLTLTGTALVAIVGWLINRTIRALDDTVRNLKTTVEALAATVAAINTQLKLGEAKLAKVDVLEKRLTKIEHRCINEHGLEGMEDVCVDQ